MMHPGEIMVRADSGGPVRARCGTICDSNLGSASESERMTGKSYFYAMYVLYIYICICIMLVKQ